MLSGSVKMLLKTVTASAMTAGQTEPESQLDTGAVGTRPQTACTPRWVCFMCWTEGHLQEQKEPFMKTYMVMSISISHTNKSKTLNSAQRKIFVASSAVSLEIKEHVLQCANKVRKICKTKHNHLPYQDSGQYNWCSEVSTGGFIKGS